MQNQSKPFAPYHPWDRAFFLTNAIVAWVAILAGFGPELYQHGRGVSPFPPLLVLVHGGVFFGWLALFLLQVWLILSRRADIHRKLGMAATVMVPLMVFLGLDANVVAQRLHFAQGQSQLNFMIIPIVDMVIFAGLAGSGLLLRKKPAVHKRLLLLATINLLDAGFGRWWGAWFLAHVGDGFFGFIAQIFLGSDLMILAALAYDRVTRGKVHPVYRISLPLILVLQMLASAFYHSPAWLPIARWLIS